MIKIFGINIHCFMYAISLNLHNITPSLRKWAQSGNINVILLINDKAKILLWNSLTPNVSPFCLIKLPSMQSNEASRTEFGSQLGEDNLVKFHIVEQHTYFFCLSVWLMYLFSLRKQGWLECLFCIFKVWVLLIFAFKKKSI